MTETCTIIPTTYSDYEVNVGNILDIDILNCSSWLVARTISDMLVYQSTDSKGTINNKRAFIYDNFYILSKVHDKLTFEDVFDYFSIENLFVFYNYKAAELASKQDDVDLLECCNNVISLSYDDYMYFLKDELTLLPELAYTLKSVGDGKSFVNLILKYSRLSFSNEIINEYKMISFLLIRFWANLVQSLPFNQPIAKLVLTNFKNEEDRQCIEDLLSDLPAKYNQFIIY